MDDELSYGWSAYMAGKYGPDWDPDEVPATEYSVPAW